MKALVFAAGLGSRLRPLTDHMPKALVPVNGRPLLQILIEKLKDEGFTEIVVNVHHFAEMIKDFLSEHNNFGIDIRISDETDMLLETGGGVKKAAQLFTQNNEPFLIHNVDILSNLALADVMKRTAELEVDFKGNRQQPAATLIVNGRSSSRYLLFDKNNILVGWTNINTNEVKTPYPNLKIDECRRFAFSGIHVFQPTLLPLMETWQGKFSIIDFYLSVCNKVPIYADFNNTLQLLDVGKPGSIALAENFMTNSASSSL